LASSHFNRNTRIGLSFFFRNVWQRNSLWSPCANSKLTPQPSGSAGQKAQKAQKPFKGEKSSVENKIEIEYDNIGIVALY
jgi:hypothetical protein